MIDTKPKLNLDEIMDRANAAAEGPWYPEDVSREDVRPTGYGVCIRGAFTLVLSDEDTNREADATFIAHARTDVSAMVRWMRSAAVGLRRLVHTRCLSRDAVDGAKCGVCPTCLAAKTAQALLDQIEP